MQINITSPINSLGFGIASLNIIKALDNQGHEITYWPIGTPQISTKVDHELIQKCYERQVKFPVQAPSLKIWHQFALAEHIGKGLRVNFPFFELDRFKDNERHHIESSDLLVVASNWAKNIVLADTKLKDKNVVIAPLGVDQTVFYPRTANSKVNFRDDPENFVFFHCGKAEIRKGLDVLVEVFNKAFDMNDKVELWLMVDNPFLNDVETKEWRDLYLRSKLGNKVKFISRVNTCHELAEIMRSPDCCLSLSRAEGFDLPLLEGMATGKQILATNYAAHQEFCNQDNSFLVDIDDLEDAFDGGKWFHGHGKWARLGPKQIEQSVEHMRTIYKKGKVLNNAGLKTAQKFSWDRTAAIIAEALKS